MTDKLKATTLCLLVIVAVIAASAFVPVDSQYADNPYPMATTQVPYPEPPKVSTATPKPREKKDSPTSMPIMVPCDCGPEDSIPIMGNESSELCWCYAN